MDMNKRLVCTGARSFHLEEGQVPEVPEKGIILKVLYCGVCHSDANVYEHGAWDPRLLPRVLGHEMSGIIHKIGKQVNDDKLQCGGRAVIFPYGGCRDCAYCRAGSVDCVNKYQPYAHTYGVWKDGGYQSYIAIEDAWCVIPMPECLPLDQACLAVCGGLTAYNAIIHCDRDIQQAVHIKGKANVAVVGAGGLGIWAIQILKHMYGETVDICVIDILKEKLKEVKESEGVKSTLCWPKEGDNKAISQSITETLHGELVDAALDFVNTQDTLERMFYSLNFGSTLMMVGLYRSTLPQFSTVDLVIKHINLQGIYCGSRDQAIKVLDLLTHKKIGGPHIEHIALEEVEPVLERMVKGEGYRGRYVVAMDRK